MQDRKGRIVSQHRTVERSIAQEPSIAKHAIADQNLDIQQRWNTERRRARAFSLGIAERLVIEKPFVVLVETHQCYGSNLVECVSSRVFLRCVKLVETVERDRGYSGIDYAEIGYEF